MIIIEMEAKNVITNSNLPICDFSVNPYTAAPTPANTVRFFYESIYKPPRTVGQIYRCEGLG